MKTPYGVEWENEKRAYSKERATRKVRKVGNLGRLRWVNVRHVRAGEQMIVHRSPKTRFFLIAATSFLLAACSAPGTQPPQLNAPTTSATPRYISRAKQNPDSTFGG